MNLFRKIFGLGPKEPVNVRPRKEPVQTKVVETSDTTFKNENILPVSVNSKTEEFDLANELAVIFHERENNYGDIIIAHVLFEKKNVDKNGESELLHIKTSTEDDDFCHMLLENGKLNFDNFKVPFEFWNPSDKNLDYKVLSCKMSFFASQKITSKKHMLEAHKLLQADELLVSIARRELIFVCDKNISEEHYEHFLNMHAHMVLQENEKLEFLCEDIFVVKNGEIDGVLKITKLSEILNAKK